MRVPLVAILVVLLPLAARAQTFLGPLPYLQASDSPFDQGGSFQLETFEDGLLNVTGASSSPASIVGPSSLTDSVDGDDGVIDGSGNGGHSCFSGDGAGGITFSFNAVALGGLPTQAGIVWTDGSGGTTVTFTAFDKNGVSLGSIVAPNQGDGSIAGTTAEDRFYGVDFAGGVGSIKITSPGGGIEVDHLQFGKSPWSLAGGAKAGSAGLPHLAGSGPLSSGSSNQLALTGAKPASTATLVTGLTLLNAPFKGGTMVPQPMLYLPLPTNGAGAASLPFVLPTLPAGVTLWFQFWIQDAAASHGLSASNGLLGVTG